MDSEKNVDPIKSELKQYIFLSYRFLNILALDNYQVIKQKVFELIKSEISQQEKLIDIIFKKSILEWNYSLLYAKLSYDLDIELPQRKQEELNLKILISKKKKTSHTSSIFRLKLLERCKSVFNEELINLESKIIENDPIEREQKLKQYILGSKL